MTATATQALAEADVWQADGSEVPVPPPATLALHSDGFVVEGPAWPGSDLRTVIARLPLGEVGDVELPSPLGLRPTLVLRGRDGAQLRVHGLPRDLAAVFDAWQALTGQGDVRVLRTPGQRLLSRLGTARVLSTIVTLLAASVLAAAYASVPTEAYDLLREERQAVDDLRVGDCFAEPEQLADGEAAAVNRVQLVDCELPHDSEVIAIVAHPADGAYPGDDVTETATQLCLDALDDVVPRARRRNLDVVFFYPTPASWAQGDREIVCAAYRPDGAPLRRPLAGSGG